MKGIFAEQPMRFQFGVLFIFIVTGALLGSFFSWIINLLSTGVFRANEHSVLAIQSSLFISSICIFLLPSLATAWLCSPHPKKFLHIRSLPNTRMLVLVTLSLLLISPLVSIAGYFNSQMELPEALKSIEVWMKSMEEQAATMTEKMLSGQSFLSLVLNILVIGVLTGITEEFLFRGALYGIMQRVINNPHSIIWIIAIIFSLIHFRFYGFIPRLILGAYLGYLLYWTKNIWVPAFAHFLNNATAVIIMSNHSLKENKILTENIQQEDVLSGLIIVGACLPLFFWCSTQIQKESAKQSIQ